MSYAGITKRTLALIKRKGFAATLRKPGTAVLSAENRTTFPSAKFYKIWCIEDYVRVRSSTDGLTDEMLHILYIANEGTVVPENNDRVMLSWQDNPSESTFTGWLNLSSLRPVSPGGPEQVVLWETALTR